MISESTINAVRSVPIETVLSKYMKLEKKGANLSGCCPFHNEKTPSFSVSPVKGFYKCFGCGVSGDAIEFVQKHERITFFEAIEKIANENGIAVEEEKSNKTPEELKQEKSKKIQASELMHVANEYFKSNELPIEYLHTKRNLSDETIAEWGLGFAPSGFHKLSSIKVIAENLQLAIDISLLSKKDSNVYDFFVNRITIPIRNHVGQLISFGARILPGEENNGPKYLNGRDSIIYSKSSTLFGLDKASKSIVETGMAVLVEGYFDVIKLHQCNWTNTVATCGTALTEGHCKLLKRYTNHVVVLRDGDSAGKKAAMKDVPLLIAQGFKTSVLLMPEGEDPDSFFDSAAEIDKEKYKSSSLAITVDDDGLKWYIKELRKTLIDDSFFIEKAIQVLATIKSKISLELYAEWYYKEFKFSKKLVTDAIKKETAIIETPALEKNTIPEEDKIPAWVDVDLLYTEGFVMNSDTNRDKIGIFYKGENSPVKRLTNYVVKPLFFVMDPLNSRRLIEVYNGKRNNVVELPNKAFTSQECFETELVGKGAFYSEPGFSKLHFKRLVNWLSDNMLNVHTLNTLGWQPEGFFAYCNLAAKATENGVDRLMYDEYGIVKIDDKAFLSEGVSKLNTDTRAEDNVYENDTYLKFVESSIDFREWAILFYKVYEEDAMFGIGFTFIAAFKDIVTKIAKCPHLYCYGPKGAGKSEYAESLMYFFFSGKNADGKLIQGYNLNPGQGTPFSFFSRQKRFRNVLMLFNEYDPNTIEFWKKGAFKSSYDGEGREIGSGETGKKRKTEIQKTQCVNIIAGQYLDTTDDGAVLSRSIPCKFSLEKNKVRTEEQKNNFRELKEIEQKGLSSLVADLYKYRMHVSKELKDTYWLTQNELSVDMKKFGKQVEARLISNYSLVIAITEVMSKYVALPFTIDKFKQLSKRRMIMQSDLLRDNNALNSFWRVVEALFDDSQLQLDIHFKIRLENRVFKQVGSEKFYDVFHDFRKVMYIRFNVIYERFAKRYREVYNKTAPDQDTLLVYLQDQKYYVGLCPGTSFKDKKTSAYILYYDTLQSEMGVNFEKGTGFGDGEDKQEQQNTTPQDDLPF